MVLRRCEAPPISRFLPFLYLRFLRHQFIAKEKIKICKSLEQDQKSIKQKATSRIKTHESLCGADMLGILVFVPDRGLRNA